MHLLQGVAIAGLLFPIVSKRRRRDAIKRWSAQLLRTLGVRLHVHGEPPPQRGRQKRESVSPAIDAPPIMMVANHVSWLDIFIIDAVVPARFVAKSEIRTWPVIGWLTEKTGTLFIRRARRHDIARINHALAEAMRDDYPFAVFPEGTTTDGSSVLKFHSSLLQPALLAGAVLYPVALRFMRPDGTLCTEAAYDGPKSLWETLLLIVAQPAIHAHVHFLPPLANHGHRRDFARVAREVIVHSLFPPSRDSRTGKSADRQAAVH
jgi:1-acyl-sn-glycerol-3-phosphate acyltransferase